MMPRDSDSYGLPPELAWLPVGKLVIDPSYQRSIESRRSQLLIARIASEFRWAAFQAILATPAQDVWKVLDGQHRIEACRRIGIAHVPAVVVKADTAAEQAGYFVRANSDRVAMNAFALFHARVAAGDEAAVDVSRACGFAGVTIPRSPTAAEHLKPGETMALGSINQAVGKLGVHGAAAILRAIMRAWPGDPGWIRASLVRAMVLLGAETQPHDRPVIYERAAAWLHRQDPITLFQRVGSMRHRDGMTEANALLALLRKGIAA